MPPLSKAKRSAAAKKAAATRKRRAAANKAGTTTDNSGGHCAEWIQKQKGGKSVLHGLPDIINVKDGKVVFYEVKPYLIYDRKKGHHDWNLAAPDDRMLSKAQLKSFKKLIKGKQQVFIIYYNKETRGKKDDYTIHKDPRGEKNPRRVINSMLKDAESSDPDSVFCRLTKF